MAVEIERKYLLAGPAPVGSAEHICQGYLVVDELKQVRVRIKGDSAFLCVKTRRSPVSATRMEWEYPIPADEAKAILALCGEKVIVKERTRIPWMGHVIEVDVFRGRHEGLIVAEIELPDEETIVELPDWLGVEVTHDERYSNTTLAGLGAGGGLSV